MRTARALGSLPLIDAAFRDGRLSYSKVRALTRVATPQNESELMERAKHTRAEGVEQIVRCVRQRQCLDDQQALVRSRSLRSLSTRWDETGALIIQGRLTPEQGEVFLKALAKATEAQPSGSASEADEGRYWNRRADALVQVMADSLGGRVASTPGDRHQLVVHVAVEALAQPAPDEAAEAGENVPAGTPSDVVRARTALHPETIRRLACDGGLVTIIEGTDHRVVHEFGYRIEHMPDGGYAFIRPEAGRAETAGSLTRSYRSPIPRTGSDGSTHRDHTGGPLLA